MAFKIITNCLACGGKELVPCIDLGDHPFANSYLERPIPREEQPSSKLQINRCSNCYHAQLSEAVDPELLYRDYKYVSGTTKTLKNHFHQLARSCEDNARVLDIGCNDGSLLEAFKDRGFGRISGVDPALNLRAITEEKGLDVVTDFWGRRTAMKLPFDCDIITALNCLAHNADPYDFLSGCKLVLSKSGTVILEFPYFGFTLQNLDLGQIYAEHHSYFSMNSIMALAERVGLRVAQHVWFPELHGGTIRIYLDRANEPHNVNSRMQAAAEQKSLHIARLLEFQKAITKITTNLSIQLSYRHSMGYKIVAYGASAKSSTLFNLDNGLKGSTSTIAYVVDDNPLKQGLYCPGSNLPIYSPEVLKEQDGSKLVILLTVHNFRKEIIERLKNMGIGGDALLLEYTPKIKITKFENL